VTGEAANPSVAIDVSAIPLATGGAGTYVRRLVASLPSAGIDPVVVTRRTPGEPWPGNARVVAAAPAARPVRLLWEQLALPGVLRRALPDVRVLHSPHYTMPVRLRGLDIARVVTVHDLTFFTRPQDHQRSKRWVFRAAIRKAARHADVIVAVSATTAEALQRIAAPRCRVEVIPHGVDHERFHPANGEDQRAADREAIGSLGIDRRFILHVGTIEPRKNLANLLRAYEILCAQMSSRSEDLPMLALAGSAWRGTWTALQTLADAITKVHPRACIARLGWVPDDFVASLYREAAAVAYPSFEEGYGLPVIEALACGAPVVTSVDTVMHELGGSAVIAVDPSDPSVIAAALSQALYGDGPPIAERVRVAGRFRWETCAEAHAVVYRSVM
jgi:glycosyltransferase involved in cell wall biosynthesis